MFIIYIKKNYNAFFNSNKNKFYSLIYYIKIMLILCLINACVLINVSITKKSKMLFAILYYVYNTFMLNLCIASFFLNKFIFINDKS